MSSNMVVERNTRGNVAVIAFAAVDLPRLDSSLRERSHTISEAQQQITGWLGGRVTTINKRRQTQVTMCVCVYSFAP